MSILGSWRVIATLSNEIPVNCSACGRRVTFKETKEDEVYTRKCGCGCEILTYHEKDEFHKQNYFTSRYIPAEAFKENYKKMDQFQQNGFKKQEGNGKIIYRK